MITGFPSLLYSNDPDATRAFFRDVLAWPNLDVGGAWLIFRTPLSEMGVHPTADHADDPSSTVPHHQVSLMCDDIHATIAELESKGAVFSSDVIDEGFGLVVGLEVPGAGTMQLYEPRHPVAHSLGDTS